MRLPLYSIAIALLIVTTVAADSIPSWFQKAPSFPAPVDRVVRVANADELHIALDRVEPDSTISLADGDYRIVRPLILRDKTNVVLRSASGDPAKVTLLGAGWEANRGDLLYITHCEKITVADLTFAEARSYGIKVEAESAPRDIHIYNCRFRNIGVRAIKGSADQDAKVQAVNGSVRFCYFENTKIPPEDWLFGGDYIAGIDMMALENWTFSDNVFRNIKGRNGGARAAIFIWVRSKNIVVERNLIIDCDRGIAFGNPGQSTANVSGEPLTYVSSGTIRNNCIVGGADCGIELWYADAINIWHNTIWRPERNFARGIRIGTGTRRTEIANNLVHGEIRREGGEAQLRNNVAARLDGYFVDAPSGNLALTRAATDAIDRALALLEISSDILGRPRGAKPDLGAFERE